MALLPEALRLVLGEIAERIRELREEVREARRAAHEDHEETMTRLDRLADDLRPKGPVDGVVATAGRIDRRTRSTLLILGGALLVGLPAMVWATGRAVADSPELVTLVREALHVGGGGGTTPVSPVQP